jgi:hypothetical protein
MGIDNGLKNMEKDEAVLLTWIRQDPDLLSQSGKFRSDPAVKFALKIGPFLPILSKIVYFCK